MSRSRRPRWSDGYCRYGDAVRYCDECVAWTGHEMRADGSYRCMLDHGGVSD